MKRILKDMAGGVAVMLFIIAASIPQEVQAKGKEAMSRDLTATYARAADAERRADPALGGVAIRLLRTDQTAGGLVQTAVADHGFIVYTPREAQGEMIANARLYALDDGLPDAEIARAERFDLILADGTYQRYRIKDAPPPQSATREWKLIVAFVNDPTSFHLPSP